MTLKEDWLSSPISYRLMIYTVIGASVIFVGLLVHLLWKVVTLASYQDLQSFGWFIASAIVTITIGWIVSRFIIAWKDGCLPGIGGESA